jgi:hypothetical protein
MSFLHKCGATKSPFVLDLREPTRELDLPNSEVSYYKVGKG